MEEDLPPVIKQVLVLIMLHPKITVNMSYLAIQRFNSLK